MATRFKLDPAHPPRPTQAEQARLRSAATVRRIRATTGLSQSAFATTFQINLARLRDLEQARTIADSALLAYLAVIEHDPAAVRVALHAANRPDAA